MSEGSSGGAHTHNKITGGTINNAVQAENVVAHFHSSPLEEQSAGARRAAWFRMAAAPVVLGLALLNMPERVLTPGGHRIVVGLGILLVLAGVLWWGAVQAGVPERLRRRWEPHPAPLLTELDQVADRLAGVLTEAYLKDEQQLRLRDPGPIPVRWSAASPLVSDHPANVLNAPAAGAADTSGGPPLDLDGHFDEIGVYFARIPRRRLVVVGAPGAGKSALALRLALSLLPAAPATGEPVQATGGPVPVLLPLASWKPTEEDLWQWAARRLAALHPAILRTPQLAHDLITRGRILPILDGLDELPAPTRPEALRRLRRSLNDPARVVLTCRAEEYEAAVDEAQTVVPGAAVVQLEPLDVADLDNYLPRTALPTSLTETAATKWAPVLAELRDPATDAPEVKTLRAVLSTPLMVSLARFVYSETRADPTNLLDGGRFADRAAVERHLFDAFFSAAYEDTTSTPGSGERARRWAGYLAARLRSTGEQDIEWWRLSDATHWSVRWLGTGLAVVVAAVAVGLTSYDDPWWREWFPVPPWAAVLLLGLVAAFVDWTGAPHAGPPQRLHRPTREELRSVRAQSRSLLCGLLLLVVVSPVLFVVPEFVVWTLGYTVVMLGVLATWILLARLLNLLSRPADPADAPEPAALLRADRRTALVLALLAPFRSRDRRPLTEVVLAVASLTVVGWQLWMRWDTTVGAWLRTAGLLVLAWVLCRWSVSAGGRLTLARFHLFFSGALPWRVMGFLGDAYRRGVLRQSGGLYRFRHVELRNRLAEAGGVVEDVCTPDSARQEAGSERAGRTVAVALSLMVALPGVMMALLTPDLTIPTPYRKPASVCALLPLAQVRQVIAEPVTRRTGDFGCEYDEKSPFRPDRRIYVAAVAWSPTWGGSGADGARQAISGSMYDDWSPLPGLGDDARMWTGRVQPHGAPGAQITLRVANLRVSVHYSEEYADRDRVVEVARILARDASRRAGVPAAEVGGGGLELGDVPLAKAPEKSRVSGYGMPERSAHGAVWRGDEHSDILTPDGLSIPLRTPPQVTCGQHVVTRDERESTYRCMGNVVSPGSPTDDETRMVVLDIADRECRGKTCSASESRDFRARRPGWSAVRWRDAPAGGARYAVSRTTEGQYEMSLFAPYATDDERPHLLWIRVAVDPEHAAVAQKIVNSAYTQATLPELRQAPGPADADPGPHRAGSHPR